MGTAIGPSLWFGNRGVIEEGLRADLVLVKGLVPRDLKCLWEGEGIVGVLAM